MLEGVNGLRAATGAAAAEAAVAAAGVAAAEAAAAIFCTGGGMVGKLSNGFFGVDLT